MNQDIDYVAVPSKSSGFLAEMVDDHLKNILRLDDLLIKVGDQWYQVVKVDGPTKKEMAMPP